MNRRHFLSTVAGAVIYSFVALLMICGAVLVWYSYTHPTPTELRLMELEAEVRALKSSNTLRLEGREG